VLQNSTYRPQLEDGMENHQDEIPFLQDFALCLFEWLYKL
jgi:hypothetical protein